MSNYTAPNIADLQFPSSESRSIDSNAKSLDYGINGEGTFTTGRGKVLQTFSEAIKNLGFKQGGTFGDGGTINSNSELVFNTANNWFYQHTGATPVAIPASPDAGWRQFNANNHSFLAGRDDAGAHDTIYRRETTVSEVQSGVFDIGSKLTITDRCGAEFNVVSGSSFDGYEKIDAGSGKIAVLSECKPVSIRAFGVNESTDLVDVWQIFIDYLSSNGVEGLIDGGITYQTSNLVDVNRNGVTIRFIGDSWIKLTKKSTIGAVLGIGTGDPNASPVSNVKIYDPQVDGDNFGWIKGETTGENGVSGSNCQNVRIYGGIAKNCIYGTNSPFTTGGKGIQFENGVKDIIVDNFTSESCSIAFESGGTVDSGPVPPVSNFSSSTQVKYTNLKAINCGRVISIQHQNSPPDTSVNTNSVVVDGVECFNCGNEADPSISAGEYGLVYIDRASNCSIKNVTVYNDDSYGNLESVIKIQRGTNNTVEVTVNGNVAFAVNHSGSDGSGSSGELSGNNFKVDVNGSCAIAVYSGVVIPGLSRSRYIVNAQNFTTRLIQSTISGNSTCHGSFSTDSARVVGFFSDISAYAENQVPSNGDTFCSGARFYKMSITVGQTSHNLSTEDDTDLSLIRNGSKKIAATARGVFMALPSSSAGLSPGDLWRDNGTVKVV